MKRPGSGRGASAFGAMVGRPAAVAGSPPAFRSLLEHALAAMAPRHDCLPGIRDGSRRPRDGMRRAVVVPHGFFTFNSPEGANVVSFTSGFEIGSP
jgi:hypothetical protein